MEKKKPLSLLAVDPASYSRTNQTHTTFTSSPIFRRPRSNSVHLQRVDYTHLHHQQLEAIKAATNNFAEENCIGRGGFGKVYKGELVHSKGRSLVAFKRLDPRFGQGNPEFWKEISMLSLYKHENIVSLLGFCDESDEKILVYEYASRRSLDMYLNNKDLSWIQRLKICIGAARGLAFLHNPSGTQQRVLHRDIKSSNILLDENWNAKISDMGLSKFGPANQIYTFLVSNTVGTIGYIDPVYVETGLLTKESDVYSLGVVLFEVLCGRLCICNMDGNHQSLIGLVWRYYAQNKISEIIFESIKDEINRESLHMFTTIAYQCLKRDVEERPLMADVVKKLEKVLEHEELQQVVDELLKAEIARITDKGGLVDFEGVEKIIQLMQPKSGDKKVDLASRMMLVNAISGTQSSECLGRFVELRGLLILDEWLQEFHKGKTIGDGSSKEGDLYVEEFLFALLCALDKLPVNLRALQTCNVGKSVNHLRSHKNPEIIKKARNLVDTWKRRVEAEMTMNVSETRFGKGSGSWPRKSTMPQVSPQTVKQVNASISQPSDVPLEDQQLKRKEPVDGWGLPPVNRKGKHPSWQ
ncbi:hypothetical protein LXL04_013314 [Taraxacum kok-saghyz]